MVKIYKFALVLMLPVILFTFHPTLAQADFLEDVVEKTPALQAQEDNPAIIVGMVISAFLGVLGVIFLVLLIYAGFLWMTAAGNDEKITKAKKILTSSIVGLVITLSAFAIADFVVGKLAGATTGVVPAAGG